MDNGQEERQALTEIENLWKAREIEKLSAFLMTLPQPTFSKMLLKTSPEQMMIFKKEAALESLVYHLLLFHHEIESKMGELDLTLNALEKKISEMEPLELTQENLESYYEQISEIKQQYQSFVPGIEKGLSIAWNSDRLDLIEKMSQLKEHVTRIIYQVIGKKEPASGIYSLLNQVLNAVYDAEQPLKDDDQAIEGLAKLGICLIPDYLKAGLLSSEELKTQKMDPQNLYQKAKDNLEKKGLHTILDLKKAGIYSPKILLNYLTRSNSSLNT